LSLKKRPEFQQMIKDAGLDLEERKGKTNTYLSNRQPQFKYILTKSVSRFSRNSETITIIRDLKQKGVFVIFDDINKSTEDAESEMLLGFLQSISQEESRNKSQIIKWGKMRSAEVNHISLQAPIYGYQSNLEENTLRIIPDEAEIVKKIFNLSLDGNGVRKIKRQLTEEDIYNRDGKQFSESHLQYILKNPKYCGLNIRNRWEKVDLYNSNKQREKPESEWIIQETDKIDKIIEREVFDKVQKLIIKRSNAKRGVHIGKGDLSQKIKCSVCGAFYTRNREVYKTGNVRVFYNCCNKKKNGVKVCNGRNVGQDEIDKRIDLFRKIAHKRMLILTQKTIIKELEERKENILKNKNNDNMIEIENIKTKIKDYENKLSNLLETTLEDSSQTLKNVFAKKTKLIEKDLMLLEKELRGFEVTEDETNQIISNIDVMIKTILSFESKENMTREEYLDEVIYISVESKGLKMITKNDRYMLMAFILISHDKKIKNKLLDFGNSIKP